MSDPFNLQRFLDEQDRPFLYDRVREELQRGAKRGHWIWYIFPQIIGLGRSATAIEFSISSLDEAKAYLAHPVLGARLIECTELVNAVEGKTAKQIFPFPDDLKFRSCMTLFYHATPENEVFKIALEKYYSGEMDEFTLEKIQ